MATDASPPALLKRKDKRKHVSTSYSSNASSVNLRDPFQVVALAVRFDESRQDAEAILKVPLESGRLYDSVQFARALEYLQKKTTAPPAARLSDRKKSSNATSSSSSSEKQQQQQQQLPSFALTPIILSGLLSIQQQREDNNNNSISDEDLSSELVMSCQTMRKAALYRVLVRKRRRRVQKFVLPILCIAGLVGLHVRHVMQVQKRLVQWHYVKNNSCQDVNSIMSGYESACRLAEAALWEKQKQSCPGGADSYCSLMMDKDTVATAESSSLAPLSMHTVLSQDVLSLDEVDRGRRVKKKRDDSSRKRTTDLQHPLRWLGESTVNRLVRQAIETYLAPKMDLNILDVGCGVGGTLYALLPPPHETRTRSFSYHGIAASAAEIYQAQSLVEHYKLLGDNPRYSISFEQKSFDDPTLLAAASASRAAYTAIVAIDTLSFSRNLKDTISNLVKSSLQPGGVLVIVDDVVYPSEAARISMDMLTSSSLSSGRRPSLLPHVSWTEILEGSGCRIKNVRDLSVEYEVLSSLDAGGNARKDVFSLWEYGGMMWERSLLFAGYGSSAARSMLQLQQNRAGLDRFLRKRQEEYRRASLVYHMYVCVKT